MFRDEYFALSDIFHIFAENIRIQMRNRLDTMAVLLQNKKTFFRDYQDAIEWLRPLNDKTGIAQFCRHMLDWCKDGWYRNDHTLQAGTVLCYTACEEILFSPNSLNSWFTIGGWAGTDIMVSVQMPKACIDLHNPGSVSENYAVSPYIESIDSHGILHGIYITLTVCFSTMNCCRDFVYILYTRLYTLYHIHVLLTHKSGTIDIDYSSAKVTEESSILLNSLMHSNNINIVKASYFFDTYETGPGFIESLWQKARISGTHRACTYILYAIMNERESHLIYNHYTESMIRLAVAAYKNRTHNHYQYNLQFSSCNSFVDYLWHILNLDNYMSLGAAGFSLYANEQLGISTHKQQFQKLKHSIAWATNEYIQESIAETLLTDFNEELVVLLPKIAEQAAGYSSHPAGKKGQTKLCLMAEIISRIQTLYTHMKDLNNDFVLDQYIESAPTTFANLKSRMEIEYITDYRQIFDALDAATRKDLYGDSFPIYNAALSIIENNLWYIYTTDLI